MRQKIWLELIKDNDYDIRYHQGKVNMVINTFSRRSLYPRT